MYVLYLPAVMAISESSYDVGDQATHEIIPGEKSLKPASYNLQLLLNLFLPLITLLLPPKLQQLLYTTNTTTTTTYYK